MPFPIVFHVQYRTAYFDEWVHAGLYGEKTKADEMAQQLTETNATAVRVVPYVVQ